MFQAGALFAVGFAEGLEACSPSVARRPAAVNGLPHVGVGFGRHGEGVVVGPAEFLRGEDTLLGAQGLAVDGAGALLVGAAVADDRLADDEGGAVLLRLAQADCLLDGGGVHAVDGADDVPAVGFEALGDVLGEGNVGVAFDGDVVVVVEIDELTEPERSRERRRLGGDAFLQVAVGDDGVGVVVDEPVAVVVVAPGEPPLGDGHADAVGEALAEGAGGRFDAGGVAKFGVPGVRLPHWRKRRRSSSETS